MERLICDTMSIELNKLKHTVTRGENSRETRVRKVHTSRDTFCLQRGVLSLLIVDLCFTCPSVDTLSLHANGEFLLRELERSVKHA